MKPILSHFRRIAQTLLGMVLIASCKTSEPAFLVMGDQLLTKDIKVNVEMLRHDSTAIATTFFEGKTYKIQNQKVLRYVIYVSYRDSLFYKIEFDNLHSEMKGEPANEIVIEKKDASICVGYKPLKASTGSIKTLLPWHIFVTEVPNAAIDKDKFTVFYGTR